jgi:hypothetical protein
MIRRQRDDRMGERALSAVSLGEKGHRSAYSMAALRMPDGFIVAPG